MNDTAPFTHDALQGETPAAFTVEGLSHRFGQRLALDKVSFEIRPGVFTVLLGLNGAGKTTLFSLATRLYTAREGTVRVFGYDVARRSSEALARIGVVFQQRTLDLDLTVLQNLLYHAALHGVARRRARERATAELERIGLLARARDKVRQLSGGQIRRVEIARALLHEPPLLLLDEPTVGLDIGSRQAILDHVRALIREQDLAVLWATHLIDEVGPEDRVIVLHQGAVLADGLAREVTAQAEAEDIRAAFTALTGGQGRGSGAP